MKLNLMLAACATAICGASIWEMIAPPTPRLIYNESLSAPAGWYKVNPKGDIKRGSFVAAFAPEKARNLAHDRGYLPSNVPLLKTVWAGPGEKICRHGAKVEASNRPDLIAVAQDDLGRDLPRWDGCITLSDTEIFLVSTHVQTSFDSRYFGAVPLQNVLGTAHFIGEAPQLPGQTGAQIGGARGERQ